MLRIAVALEWVRAAARVRVLPAFSYAWLREAIYILAYPARRAAGTVGRFDVLGPPTLARV